MHESDNIIMTNDMTKGALLPMMIKFTIPLLVGSILQLTYNAADSIIVGKMVGSTALAAVGTSNPIMTLMIMFFQGISLGTGVLVGNYFGAHDEMLLQRQVSTAMIAGCVCSVIMSCMLLTGAGTILGLLQVNEQILPHASLYLRCVSCGIIFNFIYNFYSSTLRAMGDSRSPLYFLAFSAVLNILGDLFLVVAFQLGVLGCAISTVCCEAISCLLCYFYIKQKVSVLDLRKGWFCFDWSMLKKTLQYGLVSGFQQCSIQLGIVAVQGIVNSLGMTATAAFAAANRIDDYVLIPERNLANAMTSVMAQNVGAGEKKRVRDSFWIGTLLNVSYGTLTGILLFLFSAPLMKLFTSDMEVIAEGRIYLRLIALMYILPAFTSGLQGYFRGIGEMKITFISTMLNMGSRVLCCYLLVFRFGFQISAVPWACLAGWVTMTVYELPYLLYRMKKQKNKKI